MFFAGHIEARGYSAVQRILPKMVCLLLGVLAFSLIQKACQPNDTPRDLRLSQNEPIFFSYLVF